MTEGVKEVKRTRLTGTALIILAAVLWGTTGTSQALAPPESTPHTIGALRLLIGGGGLAIYALIRDRSFLSSVPPALCLVAGIFVAAYQVCFFWGVSLTGVAVGTVVGIGSAPIFAGILDVLVLNKHPQQKWYLSTICALVGCLLLLGKSDGVQVNFVGIILALGAGLSYATYALCIKLLLPNRKAESVTAIVFCTGALFLLPLLISSNLSWVLTVNGMLIVVHLGLLATALSYFCFSKGLKTIQVSTAVTLSLAEPLTAGLLGVFVVGEQLSIFAWVGLLLIFLGLTFLVFPHKRKQPTVSISN